MLAVLVLMRGVIVAAVVVVEVAGCCAAAVCVLVQEPAAVSELAGSLEEELADPAALHVGGVVGEGAAVALATVAAEEVPGRHEKNSATYVHAYLLTKWRIKFFLNLPQCAPTQNLIGGGLNSFIRNIEGNGHKRIKTSVQT